MRERNFKYGDLFSSEIESLGKGAIPKLKGNGLGQEEITSAFSKLLGDFPFSESVVILKNFLDSDAKSIQDFLKNSYQEKSFHFFHKGRMRTPPLPIEMTANIFLSKDFPFERFQESLRTDIKKLVGEENIQKVDELFQLERGNLYTKQGQHASLVTDRETKSISPNRKLLHAVFLSMIVLTLEKRKTTFGFTLAEFIDAMRISRQKVYKGGGLLYTQIKEALLYLPRIYIGYNNKKTKRIFSGNLFSISKKGEGKGSLYTVSLHPAILEDVLSLQASRMRRYFDFSLSTLLGYQRSTLDLRLIFNLADRLTCNRIFGIKEQDIYDAAQLKETDRKEKKRKNRAIVAFCSIASEFFFETEKRFDSKKNLFFICRPIKTKRKEGDIKVDTLSENKLEEEEKEERNLRKFYETLSRDERNKVEFFKEKILQESIRPDLELTQSLAFLAAIRRFRTEKGL